MFLSGNACLNNSVLAGKCATYSQSGGCFLCNPGFYKSDKTCLACDAACRTCANGEGCIACNDGHFMTVGGQCKPKNSTAGCAEPVRSDVGCPRCLDGFFLQDRECSPCQDHFADCAQCQSDQCVACVAGHVMTADGCVAYTRVAHCTASSASQCTKCSFWHKPTQAGDACRSHAVWWVVLLIVLACLAAVALVVVGVVLLTNFILRKRRQREVERRTCMFRMARSNVSFVPTKQDGIVVNKKTIVFEETAIPIGAESKELFCVGNERRHDVKVQFIAKDDNDKFALRTEPTVVVLQHAMACEFEVFVTPLCSTTIDDKALLVVQEHGTVESVNTPLGSGQRRR